MTIGQLRESRVDTNRRPLRRAVSDLGSSLPRWSRRSRCWELLVATPQTRSTSEPEAEPESEAGFEAVTAAVEAFVEANGLEGAGLIVVDRDDGVLYHEHFGEFTEDRISVVASSKMISAGVLLRVTSMSTSSSTDP